MQALHLCFFLLFGWKALVVNALFFFLPFGSSLSFCPSFQLPFNPSILLPDTAASSAPRTSGLEMALVEQCCSYCLSQAGRQGELSDPCAEDEAGCDLYWASEGWMLRATELAGPRGSATGGVTAHCAESLEASREAPISGPSSHLHQVWEPHEG